MEHEKHIHHHGERGHLGDFEKNDMVKIIANKSGHGFKDGEIIALIGSGSRRDGSHFHIAVGGEIEDRSYLPKSTQFPNMWSVGDDEIEMYRKRGLIEEEEGEKVYVD